MKGADIIIVALVCLVLAVVLGSGRLARAFFRFGAPLAIAFFVLAGILLWRSGDWAAALILAAFAALGVAGTLAGRGRVPANIDDNTVLVNVGVPSLFLLVVVLFTVALIGPQWLVRVLEALR